MPAQIAWLVTVDVCPRCVKERPVVVSSGPVRMSNDYATILYDVSTAPVARITMNRPDKRNPIGPLSCGEIVHALTSAKNDATVQVVVITGAGKAFSAGGDPSLMSAQPGAGSAAGPPPAPPPTLPAPPAPGQALRPA